jgi:hypothetical protein
LSISEADVELIDQVGDTTFSLRSEIGPDCTRIGVLETMDEGLAVQWTRILDGRERPYIVRVMEGTDVISERRVRNPTWVEE